MLRTVWYAVYGMCIDLVSFQVKRSHTSNLASATYMQVTLSVLICIAFGLRMPRCILPPESCEEAISHIDRPSST